VLEVRCYLPRDIFDNIEKRCSDLNIAKSEYLRLLATLDVYSQNYQHFLSYFNLLDKNIKEIQRKLGMIATDDMLN